MSTSIPHQNISPEDLAIIKQAKSDMEELGWGIRNINKIGNTVESSMRFIPPKVLARLQKLTEKVLLGIVRANLLTIQKNKAFRKPSNHTYKAIVTGSGTVSGFFGSTTGLGTALFASEVALTTKFMMRTIMDIARSEGEDIYSLDGQMACLEVFALGGTSKDDDGAESSYYATRVALSSSIHKITASSVKATLDTLVKGASVVGAGTLTKFIATIASRLSIVLSEKFLAQALPIVGAAGGGTLNYVFIDHFQKMASAHFKIRRLERVYGQALVQEAYKDIKLQQKPPH